MSAIALGAPTQLGDLDDDHMFTANDLAKLVGHSSGTVPLATILQPFADLTQDGFVNDADHNALVSLILQSSSPQNLPLASVREVSPATGEGDVAVTRETVVHFSMPLALSAALDTTQFYAQFGARKILSRVEISSDRKKATLFYLEPLPSNARVQVTLAPTTLNDLVGRPVDLDGDGTAGGIYTTTFDTLSITPVAGTAVSGRVFASELGEGAGGVTVDVPLAGVTVTVDGAEETMRTTTDALGNFTLNPSPAGSFFVHIDGRTSPQSSYPNGNYYPSVGKRWEALAGRTDNLSGNGQDTSRGTIYLPRVLANALEIVSQSQDTKVDFPPVVLANNPELAGTELDIPANSLFADDGTRGGKVGIAPVAPDRLPSPLPPGLNLPMVITIQTDGATNFDRPVPITFPNLADPSTGKKLHPGGKSALWSFNHDLGDWEIVGPMTVTEDGNFVKTDAGVGIRQPGWHGQMPGNQANINVTVTPPDEQECDGWGLAKDSFSLLLAAFTAIGAVAGGSTIAPGLLITAGAAGIISSVDDYYNREGEELNISNLTQVTSSIVEIQGGVFASKNGVPSADLKFEGAIGRLGTFSGRKVLATLGQTKWERLTMAVSKISKNAGAALSWVSAGLTVKSIWDKSKVCLGFGARAKFSAANDPALDDVEHFFSLVNASTSDFGDVLNNLLSAKLQPLLPGDREVLLISSLGVLKILELDGSAYINPSTGLAFSMPLVNLFDDRLLTNKNFRENLMSKARSGAKKYAEVFKEDSTAFKKCTAVFGKVRDNVNRIINPTNHKPDKGTFFYVITNALTGDIIARGKTSQSEISLVMPADTLLRVEYASIGGTIIIESEPLYTNLGVIVRRGYVQYGPSIGVAVGISPSSGSTFNVPSVALNGDTSVDTDSDEVGDDIERVVGTNSQDPDTDGDGISDGAELKQGGNPLSGIIATTGIIASAPTVAPATDICALNNLAVTSNGAAGISVFNVLNGLNPTRIADVDTPGLAVSVASNGDYVAVADYLSGLAIVDISNPTSVRLSAQVNLGAAVQSVTVNGGLAIAGTTAGQVVTVDMATATVLGSVNLSSDAAIQDLTVEQDTLYALQVGKLTALHLNTLAIQGTLSLSGSMGGGQRRWRLFAGEGTLYATHTNGFNIVDTGTNPNAPTLVQNFNTAQFGWKQIVANGSGLGLAAASPNSTNDGPHNIDLYTLGAEGRTPAFGTTFETPGLAAAVSIYNGLAYVADSESGLQVISYLPYDSLGQAPTISIKSNYTLNATDKTGTAEEGKLMRLSATVTDDVQVRNVEFYVDGLLLITDGNYPFEHRFATPAISAGSPNFKVKAKATDTGGNVAWSDEFTITLVPDATPPQVLAVSPGNNAITGALTSLYASFSEPMNPNTLGTGFKLTEAGPDKSLGTADDVVSTGEISYRENIRTAFMTFATPGLQPGSYRISLQAPAADGAGNAIATPFLSSFRVYNASLDTDSDGIPDEYEALLGLNPTKSDTNNNSILDGNEDFDNDGLKNSAEFYLMTNPVIADTNGNGILDGNEDSDLDGLKDGPEAQYGTNALLVDSDSDGFDDATEIVEGSDPNFAGSPRPLTRVRSAVVSMLNAQAELAPANLVTAAASTTITYLNYTVEPLPSNLANAAASKAVSYLNSATQSLPANRDAQSGQVSYRNNP